MEIMIVIFLIGLIGGVISYNMKGSMDEGRAFKTERGIEQIGDTLRLAIARGATPAEVQANPEYYINQAGIVKDAKKLLKDGWNKPYDILQSSDKADIIVRSEKLDEYLTSKGRPLP